MWNCHRSTDKRYARDNRLIGSKSSYRRSGLAPRCRLIASWGWRRSQGSGCSPVKAVRELGSERRETVRSSTVCYHSFNLLKSRSPPLRVYCQRLVAHFALAFASPPFQRNLGWPLTITRRLIMQKASSHSLRSSYTLYAIGFSSISLP